ncbi:MAG: hypothetical protein MRY63_03895 [Neomegalonema sp.]|nr:hypothetical protein [Neomegalonema sp.]
MAMNKSGSASWLARIALLFTGFSLTGCDDGMVINRIDRDVALTVEWMQAIAARGEFPVEIHGKPWANTNAQEIASHLSMPASMVKAPFVVVEPQSLSPRQPERLVLIFNGINPPDRNISCNLPKSAKEAGATRTAGFDVFAVFCSGEESLGSGFLESMKHQPGDWPEFTRMMRQLIKAIVTDHSGDTR